MVFKVQSEIDFGVHDDYFVSQKIRLILAFKGVKTFYYGS